MEMCSNYDVSFTLKVHAHNVQFFMSHETFKVLMIDDDKHPLPSPPLYAVVSCKLIRLWMNYKHEKTLHLFVLQKIFFRVDLPKGITKFNLCNHHVMLENLCNQAFNIKAPKYPALVPFVFRNIFTDITPNLTWNRSHCRFTEHKVLI